MIPGQPMQIDAAKTYWLSGRTLQALLKPRVHAGPGLLEKGNIDGSKTLLLAKTPQVFGGSFYTRYTSGDGHTFLQGGTVTGGAGGSESIADYKVVDATTGITSAAGQILYVVANVTATVEDGLLMPGCLLNSASLATGGAVPDNHTFTVAAPTGDLHFELGRWIAGGFLPAGIGGLVAGGCIGNFTLSRVESFPPP